MGRIAARDIRGRRDITWRYAAPNVSRRGVTLVRSGPIEAGARRIPDEMRHAGCSHIFSAARVLGQPSRIRTRCRLRLADHRPTPRHECHTGGCAQNAARCFSGSESTVRADRHDLVDQILVQMELRLSLRPRVLLADDYPDMVKAVSRSLALDCEIRRQRRRRQRTAGGGATTPA